MGSIDLQRYAEGSIPVLTNPSREFHCRARCNWVTAMALEISVQFVAKQASILIMLQSPDLTFLAAVPQHQRCFPGNETWFEYICLSSDHPDHCRRLRGAQERFLYESKGSRIVHA